MKDDKKKLQIRVDKFGYTEEDIKGIKLIKAKKKKLKESYSSFAEFLFEKEEKFVASTMRWITIKDERDRNQHILIKKKDGTILAGMGGEHNGKKLDQAFKDIADDKKEIEKQEEPRDDRRRTSQLLTKAMDNTKILDNKELKKYVSSFKKDAIKALVFHKEMDISSSKKINLEQHNSLAAYSGSSYSIMNRLLREPEFYDEKLHPDRLSQSSRKIYEKYIEDCYTALKNNRTTEAVVTYRGVKSELMEKLAEAEPGDIITDDGFASTSTSKKIAEKFAGKYSGGYVMTVLIPKGSQAASIKSLSHYPKESEVLINKKARFEIKNIDHEAKEMIVELLPHEDD
jgi:hypothetical protein